MVIRLKPGARPWRPAEDVEEVKVLHFYDIPLIGLVRQDGQAYLYECTLGHEIDTNVWAYVPVTEDEVERLLSKTGDEFSVEVDRAFKARPVLVAEARDYRLTGWQNTVSSEMQRGPDE